MWKAMNGMSQQEGGITLRDEEYKGSCRITLVKFTDRYEITCGVYGAMFHTVYCGENHQEIYEAMKMELQAFIDKNTTRDEEYAFYDDFTVKY